MDRSTTVITGATDGIGLALAHEYDQRGDRLILLGRRPISSLDDPLFSNHSYARIDLAQTEETRRILGLLETHRIDSIDRLILNAGTGSYGPVSEEPPDRIRDIVSVNLSASIALLHHCWSRLANAHGRVVLIGSVIAALPCPDYAVYGATKAAIDGLARSLRHELAPDVAVQVIHPGATRTGLHEKIGVDERRVDWRRFPTAEVIAGRVVRRVGSGSWRSLLSMVDRILWTAGRRLARQVDWLMGRR
jgi:short-subunit dehydrogenase